MSSSCKFGAKAFAVAAGLSIAATGAMAAPPFWGSTYAVAPGPDDPANFYGGRPVRVSALLPGDMACMDLVGARLDDPGPYPRVVDMLRAAPVIVTLERSSCPEPGKDRWLTFYVPHPFQADILNLVYVTTAGKPIASEKVIISQGAGGGFRD